MQQCSRCKEAFYCGAQCQLSDWRAHHKAECGRGFDSEEERVAAGKEILRALLTNPVWCKRLGDQFKKTDGAVALSVIIQTHFEMRMALKGRLRCAVMMDDDDICEFEPYRTHKPRPGLDFVFHLQMGRPGELCSSVAVAIPLQ